MKIGNVEFNGKAVLAPMAGVADRAFRELCVGYGAAYVVSEMISSKGVSMGDRKSKDLMFLSENERPAAVQIFGNDPKIMAESIESVMKVNPQIIDINMGCPAPKIIGNGGGASLAKNPQLAEQIIKEVVKASPVPVTVKIRAGWDENSINAVEMAQRAENAGASAITIHGRTKKQMYAPPVDRNIIAEVKKAVSIPVIGNGDIVAFDTRTVVTKSGYIKSRFLDDKLSVAAILGFARLINELREYSESNSLSDTVEYVIEQTGYRKMLAEEENGEEREQNVLELVSSAKLFAETSENPTLDEFLNELALVSDLDNYEEENV